ncbi:recombinase family protein [uncultured Tateyamaria sp.]|uniref:recombinase family protein n=1 Tax=uncultured Tateyamaria sp. TaxID=455651 RepID=UPI0026288C60|nr:recombinase family protein [uncultured Tateyamaria sp.]
MSASTLTPRHVGYIRVSTERQQIDRQVMQLEECCDVLRIEHISAVATERPVFNAALQELRRGDTFVVVDLDRAFRSAIDAILTADQLDQRGVHFKILTFPMNTGTDEGAFVYGILALAAQLERKIIRRRTREGLAAARRRGVRLGRPAHLSDATIREAHDWMRDSGLPCRYVAALLGVSRLTLQRSFHRMGLAYPLTQTKGNV